ncbi:MAG: hypothetical protein ABI702_12285 [Burkholderiales bacterium]
MIVAIGAAGLLGAALQAQAHAEQDRLALEARVAAIRAAIQRTAPDAPNDGGPLAQWFNWGNWNNWNNWPNWGNWGNWLNKR